MNVIFRLMNGPTDWPWIIERIPVKRVEDTCGMVAVDEDTGEIKGAVVFDNFTHNSAQVSIATATPMVMRYGFLEEACDMLFEHFGKDYMYSFVRDDNDKALKLNKHLGFKEKTRMKDAYRPGVDYIIMELHKDNCVVYNQYLSKVA
mgnify:CR=1 FL=1